MPYEKAKTVPENPFAELVIDQQVSIVPSFTLESGITLQNVPVAYTTRGKLSPEGDNALIICHALSGSADVADWWGPIIGGSGKAADLTRFFVICINTLGSPYGSASPCTYKDGDKANGYYGPEFPLTTIRDDVRLSKLVLDDLGVKQVASVIGGSMGGMLVLEFAYLGKDYIKTIAPIATSAKHSAWCIAWGEAQRQCIYADPKYEDGYYSFDDPPATGLGAARMSALLTYRSRDSFETRFGRHAPDPAKRKKANGTARPTTPPNPHFAIHNDGHRNAGSPRQGPRDSMGADDDTLSSPTSFDVFSKSKVHLQPVTTTGAAKSGPVVTVVDPTKKGPTTYFSAQSYLRYQGDKYIQRYDANCHIAITRKLDTHDVSYHAPDPAAPSAISDALRLIEQPTLILGIKSDGLFTFAEQEEIAAGVPNGRLHTIESPEGHDAFLLQFEQVNQYLVEFFKETLSHIFEREPAELADVDGDWAEVGKTKTSAFGEAEAEDLDLTAW